MITWGIDPGEQQQALAAFFCLPDNLALTLDGENRITAVSAGLVSQLGHSEEAVVGTPFQTWIFPDDWTTVVARLEEARDNAGSVRFAARLRCANGQFVALAWSAIVVGDAGAVVLSAHEVAMALSSDARLAPEVLDRLTGLPNLALFLDRVEHALERLRRNPQARFAVVSLGLDRFHLINHRFGYWAGDLLLTEVARRLRSNIRPTDMVSRVGGDEFCVLLEDIRDASSPLRVVQRWRERIATPFPIGGVQVTWGFSCGVAVAAGERAAASTSEALLSEAQLAMRQAKRDGGAGTVISDPTLHWQVQQRLELEEALREGVTQQAFEPYFQPLVDLRNRRIVGFEVLVRWLHPQRGIVAPGEFIGLAESTGLIDPIGRLTIDRALAHFSQWLRQSANPSLTLAINVSPRQLAVAGFDGWLLETIANHGVPPQAVEVEITETVVLDEREETLAALKRLAAAGVHLMLDDFGTGYSSLSCLHRLPVHAIKIDRSFIATLHEGRGGDFVRGVVALARSLDLGVICEGIETEQQHDWLRTLGAHRGQGYLYSRPVAADQALAMWLCSR
jgi:diguanylate cyclase (GGDEF)-like protein